jgi:hypothetical protein
MGCNFGWAKGDTQKATEVWGLSSQWYHHWGDATILRSDIPQCPPTPVSRTSWGRGERSEDRIKWITNPWV